MKAYCCIQTIVDKINYRPEDRLTCILYDKYTKNILLTSRKVNLWAFETHEEIQTSHENPVSVALYNDEFENVVSFDDTAFISVWDIENGKLLTKFQDISSKQKITAACFDSSQRRIVTANSKGNIKVWNFSNGQCLSIAVYPGCRS